MSPLERMSLRITSSIYNLFLNFGHSNIPKANALEPVWNPRLSCSKHTMFTFDFVRPGSVYFVSLGATKHTRASIKSNGILSRQKKQLFLPRLIAINASLVDFANSFRDRDDRTMASALSIAPLPVSSPSLFSERGDAFSVFENIRRNKIWFRSFLASKYFR